MFGSITMRSSIKPPTRFYFIRLFSNIGLPFAILQIADALPRDRFRIGRVIEYLDANPAAVIDFFQCSQDRHEVGLAESGAALVRIVSMKMGRAMDMALNQLSNRRFIAG